MLLFILCWMCCSIWSLGIATNFCKHGLLFRRLTQQERHDAMLKKYDNSEAARELFWYTRQQAEQHKKLKRKESDKWE